jgi:hypothetical protein
LNLGRSGSDQHIAENWRRREDRGLPDDVFDKAREEEWRRAACDPEEAPYVVEALTPRVEFAFRKGRDSAARLAAVFLGNECVRAKGISAETRATLEWWKQASTHDMY